VVELGVFARHVEQNESLARKLEGSSELGQGRRVIALLGVGIGAVEVIGSALSKGIAVGVKWPRRNEEGAEQDSAGQESVQGRRHGFVLRSL
jgi:hypothetical protein